MNQVHQKGMFQDVHSRAVHNCQKCQKCNNRRTEKYLAVYSHSGICHSRE